MPTRSKANSKSDKSKLTRNVMLALGIILIAVVLAVVLTRQAATKNGDNKATQPSTQQPGNGNTSESPLAVKLTSDKESYRYGDAITFSSEILNTAGKPKTYTFSSTCTQGKLYIDEQRVQAGQLCGAAMTDVVLEPNQPKQYTYKFKLVKAFSQPSENTTIEHEGEVLLKPGHHQAHLEWKDGTSQKIHIQVAE